MCDNIPGPGLDLDIWNSSYVGCKCQLCSNKCACLNRSTKRNNYDKDRKLNVDIKDDTNWHLQLYPINECNQECLCNEINCSNRVVQQGPSFNFEVFDCEMSVKGKGLRAKDFIPASSFVIEYIGEIITEDEALRLLKQRTDLKEPNYIMFLREFYSDDRLMQTTVIDARNYSNQARYINHSCCPNLFLLPVRIDNIVPHAALFSLRDILPNEELSYDYNGTVGTNKVNGSKKEMRKNQNVSAIHLIVEGFCLIQNN